jgi:DNA helicase IV
MTSEGKDLASVATGSLVRWPAGGASAYGVVIDMRDRGRRAKVRFDTGSEQLFSVQNLERAEFAIGLEVLVRGDGATGKVVKRAAVSGFLVYSVALPDGSVREVPEARVRPDQVAREAAARTAREAAAVAEAAEMARASARRAEEKARAAERRRQEAELRRIAEAQAAERKAELVARLGLAFESDFLSADNILSTAPARGLLSVDEYRAMKVAFVRSWAARELEFQLDDDQASAVAATTGDVKVVARAGSGKTRTLAARTVFLQRHCGVSPRELLLLAFNRSAAAEMRARLAPVLGDNLPHVMTFHALAYALVHPDEDLVFDDPSSGSERLSREVQWVIDEHLLAPESSDLIRDVMLAHFREDWDRIEGGGFKLSIDELLRFRRDLPRETLAGETVKSFGERVIANTLFENDVKYAYERSHRWNGVNYKPDFTVLSPGADVVIEYFGLAGEPDYDEMSAAKRAYWAGRDGWTMLEYTPGDITRDGVESFRFRLLADLAALGVPSRQRSEEEIWQEVRQRAIDHFTKSMTGFIGRCRKKNLTPDALASMVAGHDLLVPTEGLFLEVAQSVFAGYLNRLRGLGKEDFDGLMWRAVSDLRSGQTRFARDHAKEQGDLSRIRYVLVDEFQDFSAQFYELLIGIRRASPIVQFFCVGDDWQAINGFAGADLKYYADFAALFSDAQERQITTNYRSASAVVHAGNALMQGLGVPARPHTARLDGPPVQLCLLNEFSPSSREQELHRGDELTPAVLRLVRHYLDRGQAVVLLSRRNSVRGYVNYPASSRRIADGLERFVSHVRSFLPEEDRDRVTISTTHGFKGLEQDAVVILDGLQGSYPLIHPSWVFMRIFGDSLAEIEAAERRLFYVALTRARTSLSIVTEAHQPSPFLADIEGGVALASVEWAELPGVTNTGAARLEVRAYDAYSVKDRLRDLHYRWSTPGRYWARLVAAEGFDAEALLEQDWVDRVGRIVVLGESDEVILDRRCGVPKALGNL